jgi:hypothetical protein
MYLGVMTDLHERESLCLTGDGHCAVAVGDHATMAIAEVAAAAIKQSVS